MSKINIARELLEYIRVCRKWWLIPIIVFLALLGAFIVITESSAVVPWIYAMF